MAYGAGGTPITGSPPGCRVFNSAAQSIPNNSTTALTWDSERFDTDNMHSTSVNTSRITFNTAGVYVVTANVLVTAGNDYATIAAHIRLNAGNRIAGESVGPYTSIDEHAIFSVSTIYKFAVADFVEARVYQKNSAAAARNAGGVELMTEFSAMWMGLGT